MKAPGKPGPLKGLGWDEFLPEILPGWLCVLGLGGAGIFAQIIVFF